jgi:predicted MFS family arabinose efflux permease
MVRILEMNVRLLDRIRWLLASALVVAAFIVLHAFVVEEDWGLIAAFAFLAIAFGTVALTAALREMRADDSDSGTLLEIGVGLAAVIAGAVLTTREGGWKIAAVGVAITPLVLLAVAVRGRSGEEANDSAEEPVDLTDPQLRVIDREAGRGPRV